MRLGLKITTMLLCLFLSSCSQSGTKLQGLFTPLLKNSTLDVNYSIEELNSHLGERLEDYQYLHALALIRSGIHHGFPEKEFPTYYPEALNGVLQQAVLLQENDQPRDAGMLYQIVRVSYPSSDEIRRATAMNLTEIDASIELCANRLLEKGLASYREGNFEQALDYWEKISEFHPNHKVSIKAIATTRIQLANLEEHN